MSEIDDLYNMLINSRILSAIPMFNVDALTYGTSTIMIVHRKWWNPMRWILGPIKIVNVKPQDIYKKGTKTTGGGG